MDTPTDRVYVRLEGPFDAAERAREVPVAAGGRVFRLNDMAEVHTVAFQPGVVEESVSELLMSFA